MNHECSYRMLGVVSYWAQGGKHCLFCNDTPHHISLCPPLLLCHTCHNASVYSQFGSSVYTSSPLPRTSASTSCIAAARPARSAAQTARAAAWGALYNTNDHTICPLNPSPARTPCHRQSSPRSKPPADWDSSRSGLCTFCGHTNRRVGAP